MPPLYTNKFLARDGTFKTPQAPTYGYGIVGPVGPAGPTGATGAAGGSTNTAPFRYSNNTVEPPPGSDFELNSTTFSAATKLWIDDTSMDNVVVRNYFTQVNAGDDVYIQERSNSTDYQVYQTTGPATFKTGYTELPITWLRGGNPISNNAACIIGITRAGPAGTVVGSLPFWRDSTVFLTRPLINQTLSNAAVTANRLTLHVISVPQSRTFTTACIKVSTFIAASTARIGAWNVAADNGPGTLIWDTGDFSTASNGFKTSSISWAASPGNYYIGTISSGAISVLVASGGEYMATGGLSVSASVNVPVGNIYEDIAYPSGGLPDLTSATMSIALATDPGVLIGIR
jgi:hypothetical protein